MKRTPLRRKTPLGPRSKEVARKSRAARVAANRARAKERRRLKFGAQAKLCHEMPCCVCYEQGKAQASKTQAHHEPPRSHGGIDVDCLPICREHHAARHATSAAKFWASVGIDFHAVIAHMRRLTNERIARGEAA